MNLFMRFDINSGFLESSVLLTKFSYYTKQEKTILFIYVAENNVALKS